MRSQQATACPRCHRSQTDTVTSTPYVRWLVLSPAFGTRRLLGCRRCVREQLLAEMAANLTSAWHGLTLLAGNLACFVWNAARVPVLKSNPSRVEALMFDLGLDSRPADLPRIAAALAAVVVAADGRVQQQEVDIALELGEQLIEGFAPELFIESLENVHLLPSPTALAGLLADCLDEPAKARVMGYLLAIARADNDMDESEVAVLKATASAMRTPPLLGPGGDDAAP